jgi:hypothetical protein
LPKCYLEFQKFAEILEVECLIFFLNLKRRGIDMLAPLKWVGKKYKTMIAKMEVDNGFVTQS